LRMLNLLTGRVCRSPETQLSRHPSESRYSGWYGCSWCP
jgi:hypothetical protein